MWRALQRTPSRLHRRIVFPCIDRNLVASGGRSRNGQIQIGSGRGVRPGDASPGQCSIPSTSDTFTRDANCRMRSARLAIPSLRCADRRRPEIVEGERPPPFLHGRLPERRRTRSPEPVPGRGCRSRNSEPEDRPISPVCYGIPWLNPALSMAAQCQPEPSRKVVRTTPSFQAARGRRLPARRRCLASPRPRWLRPWLAHRLLRSSTVASCPVGNLARASWRLAGSSTVKVAPAPGRLSTRIEPPWASTIRRLM